MKYASIAVLLALSLASPAVAQAPAPANASPAGVWRTFNDEGAETGRVKIWEQSGVFSGQVVGIDDPAKAKATCEKCSDARKDKPVMGMVILTGLKPDGDRWTGGDILDPEKGSVYSCSMRLEDGGRKLVVRGFIGISLIGRSQTWARADAG